MPPKKNKKISLNEFLGDTGSASWADEMDSLPNAPAVRPEGDTGGRDRFGRDDFLSSRPDRGPAQPREDVPLPTAPPYTAFIGNLSFDLTEADLEDFFGSAKTIKIIKDREDKPKGFGYIEFEELDGLKDALSKHGQSFSGRTIRVSVAEPPKERGGFGSGQEDSGKFDDPWRRGGPLPDLPGRESRKRFDGPPREDRLPSVSEGPSDWRSSMPSRAAEVTPPGSIRRKGPGFVPEPGAADTADSWTKGSKFRPSAPEDDKGGRFGARRGDIPPRERDGPTEESDWRSRSARPVGHSSTSPNSSTPPTPQMGRRKLELLPRTGGPSGGPSPLSSPKIGPTPTASANSTKSNPFGAAKPVDVSNKDKEVAEKLEKEREATKERLTMSRTNSRTGVDRPTTRRIDTPPTSAGAVPSSPRQSTSERIISPKSVSANANVRPAISFASVASKKDGSAADQEQAADDVDDVADKVAETSL